MWDVESVSAFFNAIIETEAAHYRKTQEAQLGHLDLLDKEIAEEEAFHAATQQLIKEKTAALALAQASGPKEIASIEAETLVIAKKHNTLKKEIKLAAGTIRMLGAYFASYLKVNYQSHAGRVLCPEGKICASVRKNEEECNYWDCPIMLSVLQNPTNGFNIPNGNRNHATLAATTSQFSSLSLSAASNFAANNVTLIPNGNRNDETTN